MISIFSNDNKDTTFTVLPEKAEEPAEEPTDKPIEEPKEFSEADNIENPNTADSLMAILAMMSVSMTGLAGAVIVAKKSA